ncbi:hypothetical protein C2G38_2196429 [Gigaspora rosea]|uniref:Uncharacterized protein n=1 Tax=Gigaspora rosea TaxID=44941 RepID=A0A397UVZ9_9GLOM|nr:hypothetical protein C2G38_2196429 [Gigaspora rosea]
MFLFSFGALNTNGNNSTNNTFLLDVSQKKNNYEWITSYDPLKPFQSVTTTTIPSVTSSASPKRFGHAPYSFTPHDDEPNNEVSG